MSEMDSLKLLQLEMLANAVINSPSEVNQSTTPTQSNYGSEKHSPANHDIINDEGFSADENKVVSNNVNCNGEDHEIESAFMYGPQQENISSRSLFESPRNLFCQNELVIVENVKTEPPDLGFSDDETGEQDKMKSIENDITNTISQLVDNINDDQLETKETAYEESVCSRQYVNNVENGNVYYELSDLLTNDEKLGQNCFVKLVDCKGILNLDRLNLIPSCVEKKRKLMDKATLESSDKVKQFKLSNDFNTVQNELDNRSVIQTKLNVSCGEKLSTVVPSFISTLSMMTSSSHLLSNKKVKKFSSEKSDLNPLKNSNNEITSLSTSSTVSSGIGFVASSPLSTTSTTKTSLVTSTLHSTPFKSRSNIFSILTPAKEIEDSSYATNCMENMPVSSTSLLTSKGFSFSGWSSLRTTLQMSSAKCNKKKYQPVVSLKNLTDFDVSKICQQLKNSPNMYTDRNDSKSLSTSSSFSEELKTTIVPTTSNVDNFDKNSHLSKKTDTSNKPKINPPSQTPQLKHQEVESTKKQDKKMRPSLDKKSKYSSTSSSKSNRREENEKKTKEEEVLKKLQDTIRIKPVKQQSSNQVKRIPKINQMLTEEDKARSVLAKIDTAEPLEFNSKYQPAIRGGVQSYGQANNYQNTGYRDRFNFYKNGGDGDRSFGWRRNYDKSRDDDGNKLNKRLNDLSAMNRQYINNNRFNSRDNSTSSNKPQSYNWFDDLPYADGCDDDGDRDDVDKNKNSSTKSIVSENKKSQRYNWFNDLSTDAGCDDGEADYDNADKNNNKCSNAVRSNNNKMPIERDDSTKVNTTDNNKPQRYNWFSDLPFDAGFDDGKAGNGSINKNDSRSGSYGNNNKIVTANNGNNNKINAIKNEKDDKVNSVEDNNSSRPQRYNWSSDASFDIGFNDDRAEYGAGSKGNSMPLKNNKTGSISGNINNKANAINNNINNYVNPFNNNNKQQRYNRLNNLSSDAECSEDKVDYSTFNKNSSPFSNNSKMSGISNKVDIVHNNINTHPFKNNEIDLDKSLKGKFLDAFKEILKKDDSLNLHTRRQVSDICLHIQEQISKPSSSKSFNRNKYQSDENDDVQMTNMLDILRPLVPNSCYQSLHQEMITNKKNKSKGLLPLPSSPFQSPTSSLPSPRPSYSGTNRPASSLLPDPVHINQQDKTCKNALLPNPPSSDSLSSQDQYRRADFNKMSQTSKPLLSTPAAAAVSIDLDKDRIDDELLSRKRAAMLSYEEYKKLKEEESSVLLKLEEEIKIMEMLITIQKELLAEDEQNKPLDESNGEDASTSCTKTANANDAANLAVHNDVQVEMLNRTPCTANSNDNNTCDNRVVSPSSSTPSSVKTMNEHANNDKTNVLPPDKQQLDAKALEDKIIVYSRNALKSHYHKGAVTSQEFKVIMRKAITKISESKSKDITQARVSKFIDAYVEKLTAQRRKTKLGL